MRFKELLTSALLFPVFPYAFSAQLKNQVRLEQNNTCLSCHREVNKLEIHHGVPESLGGADVRENAYGLCGRFEGDCHEIYDQLALRDGIHISGVSLSEVPDSHFASGYNHFSDESHPLESREKDSKTHINQRDSVNLSKHAIILRDKQKDINNINDNFIEENYASIPSLRKFRNPIKRYFNKESVV